MHVYILYILHLHLLVSLAGHLDGSRALLPLLSFPFLLLLLQGCTYEIDRQHRDRENIESVSDRGAVQKCRFITLYPLYLFVLTGSYRGVLFPTLQDLFPILPELQNDTRYYLRMHHEGTHEYIPQESRCHTLSMG